MQFLVNKPGCKINKKIMTICFNMNTISSPDMTVIK